MALSLHTYRKFQERLMRAEGNRYKKSVAPNAAGEKTDIIFKNYSTSSLNRSSKDVLKDKAD